MKIILKGRHLSLTPALKTHAEEKLSKAVKRIYDDPSVTMEIELGELGHIRNGESHECRVSVFLPHAKTVVICEHADDMYKAIDLAHDRLMLQIKRQLEKSISKRRKERSAQRFVA